MRTSQATGKSGSGAMVDNQHLMIGYVGNDRRQIVAGLFVEFGQRSILKNYGRPASNFSSSQDLETVRRHRRRQTR